MPIMTNFTQLVAVARTYLNRDSSVVPDANAISFAVQSAEATFTAALKPPGTLVTTTLTTTGRYTPLPNNFVEIQRAVLLHNGGFRRPLEFASRQAIGEGSSFVPQMAAHQYSIEGLALEYPGASGSQIELLYYRTFPSLEQNDTIAQTFLQTYPAVYLYGVLIELAAFFQDVERMQTYQLRFETALSEATTRLKRSRYGVAPATRLG